MKLTHFKSTLKSRTHKLLQQKIQATSSIDLFLTKRTNNQTNNTKKETKTIKHSSFFTSQKTKHMKKNMKKTLNQPKITKTCEDQPLPSLLVPRPSLRRMLTTGPRAPRPSVSTCDSGAEGFTAAFVRKRVNKGVCYLV